MEEATGDTRWRILALLCGANLTTAQLARELGISANGVRGHLQQLEREGMVEYEVVRRGVGKPAHEYRLTPTASVRLSRAYLPVLIGLLRAVSEADGSERTESLLREVGRRLGEVRPRPQGTLRSRAQAATDLIAELGGISSIREDGEELWLDGACCPLRALVAEQPLTCKAIESMLQQYAGVPVREECRKVEPVACRLRMGA